MSKVTKQISSRARLQVQICLLPKPDLIQVAKTHNAYSVPGAVSQGLKYLTPTAALCGNC